MKLPITLNLTVQCLTSPRASFPGAGHDFQSMLALFNGHTVEARVYTSTNKCFTVTKQMILDAWSKLDKKEYFWVEESQIEGLIERFCTPRDNGHTLSMSLPNFFCKETPEYIEARLRQ